MSNVKTPDYLYSIREDEVGGVVIFELWGRNDATGYEWLQGEFNTRREAMAAAIYWHRYETELRKEKFDG